MPIKTSSKKAKNSFLRRSFSLSTTKGKLLAFMVVFAALGGGYAAYQTFAGTVAPLVYTKFTSSADFMSSNTLISSVNPDGTTGTIIHASGWSSKSPASGTFATSGRYSPNRGFVAWTTTPNPDPGQTATVHVRNMSSMGSKSEATKNYKMPAGESSANSLVPLAWYPDNTRILLNTWKASNNSFSLWILDTSTGKFTKALTLPANGQGIGASTVQSMTVLGNNKSIIYTDHNGVQFVSVGATTPKQLKAGPDGSCGKVRARPGTQTEFVYVCSEPATTKRAVYKQTTLTAPVEIAGFSWVTNNQVGAKAVTLNDFALSPDGTKVALHVLESTTTNVASCEYSIVSKIFTTTFDSMHQARQHIAQIANPVTQQGCKGGGESPDINRIVWSPDNKSIGYIWWNGFSAYSGLGTGLATVTVPRPGTTDKATITQLNVTDVNDLSW